MTYEIVYVRSGEAFHLSFGAAIWPPAHAEKLSDHAAPARTTDTLVENLKDDLHSPSMTYGQWISSRHTLFHGDLGEYVRQLQRLNESCKIIVAGSNDVLDFESRL